MRAFVVVISSLLLAAPGLAQASEDSAPANGAQPSQTATPTGSSPSTTAGDDAERQICRRVDTNTGSRVPWRRLCMTEREWRVYNRQD